MGISSVFCERSRTNAAVADLIDTFMGVGLVRETGEGLFVSVV